MEKPLCSIVILSYNQLDYTKKCLESIRIYTRDVTYEIIVIDNGSGSETITYLKKIPDIRLILNSENRGFAEGCNQGIKEACGDYILLLNNDTVVTKRWLYNMIQFMETHPDADMTGPLTNATVGKQMIETAYPPGDMGAMQEFGAKISGSDARPWRTIRLVAFCLLTRRKLFEEIGLFDVNFYVGNYEDDDLNIRALLAGKKAYVCRNSFIHHFMNVSFRNVDIKREKIMLRNKAYLEEKWNQINWNHHAAYNHYMLDQALQCRGRKLLHIGCGLGALEVELRDIQQDWYVAGMESHPLRAEIASNFCDIMYPFSEEALEGIAERFDVVIIECTVEKWGVDFLPKVKKLMNDGALLLVRVFNARHITSIEKVVSGQIGGKLLCAVSEGFTHYYDKGIREKIEGYGYVVLGCQDIIKNFSSLQSDLYETVKDKLVDEEDVKVYNRIYCLQVRHL